MQLTDADATALFARLGSLEDPHARRGLRHSQRSLIAIVLCAVISGAQGPTSIGEWGLGDWLNTQPPGGTGRRMRARRALDGKTLRGPPAELHY